MTIKPQGKITVTTAGTPVQIFTNDPGGNMPKFKVAKIRIEPLPANTGKIYVGSSTLDKSSMVGVLDILNKWPTTGPPDRFLVDSQEDSNVLFPDEYWLDADTSGEGAVVSFWIV